MSWENLRLTFGFYCFYFVLRAEPVLSREINLMVIS